LIAKLAALIPRPHKNLILYHGVLAANAAWRKRVVAYGRNSAGSSELDHPVTDPPQPKRKQWADLMRGAFGYDLLSCPNCGGKMQLLACIMERGAIARSSPNSAGRPIRPRSRAPAPLPVRRSSSTPQHEPRRASTR
jgi:hypothetical protein